MSEVDLESMLVDALSRGDRLEGKIRNALILAEDPGFGEYDADWEDVLGILRVALGPPWSRLRRAALHPKDSSDPHRTPEPKPAKNE